MGNILTYGQISGLTNRNHIRLCMRVRLQSKLKPDNYTESCMVNVADGWRERNVWYPGRSVRNVPKGITIIVRVKNLLKMGVPKDLACQAGNSRRGYWFTTQTVAVNMAMTKERLINSGFYNLATAYQSMHDNC